MDKYVEAFNYVTNSLCVALACLGVEDREAMESLEVLRELVDKYKTSETHNAALDAMETNKEGE